jgi:hypothetical protein
MLNVINQFRRIYSDDGRNDKSFDIDEARLRRSLTNLKNATEELIKASQTLHDLLLDKERPGALH